MKAQDMVHKRKEASTLRSPFFCLDNGVHFKFSLKQLSQQEFSTRKAAKTAIKALEEQWKFHQAEVSLEKEFHYKGPGRPRKDQKPEHVGWQE